MKPNGRSLECKSGFVVSCQASQTNYSTPRNDAGPYSQVELGFPNAEEPLIIGYADDPDDPTGTVYGYVPAYVITALIMKHGGLVAGDLPPLVQDGAYAAGLAELMQEYAI
jgi:hypothetical protein